MVYRLVYNINMVKRLSLRLQSRQKELEEDNWSKYGAQGLYFESIEEKGWKACS